VKRAFRITRSIDIKRVRQLGKTYTHPFVVLKVTKGTSDNSRAGFITGKTIGNAVKRNHAKRRLKAIFLDFLPNLLVNSDLLVIAREPIHAASYGELRTVVTQLLKRAELLDPDECDAGRPTS